MKINFFICTMHCGGAEHQVALLANMLDSLGHDVTITTYGDESDHYLLRDNIKRVRLAPFKHKIRKFLAIFKYFYRNRNDVLISYCQRNNYYISFPLLFNRRPKLIVGERSFTLGEPTKTEKKLFKLYKRATHIVCNSNSQANHIKEFAPQLTDKVTVIHNFTDPNVYRKKEAQQRKSNKPIICCFARYNPEKNYLRLSKAVKILKDKGYEFRIDWYGRKYNQGGIIRPEYLDFENIIHQLEINDCFNLNDSIVNVEEYLNKYDCAILPSIYEGFSNTIAEAISCGLPVLASNVSDNPTMVHENTNGFLFDPQNVDSMVNALERFLKLSWVERIKMGEESSKIASMLFNKDKFLNSYLKLII